MVKESYLLKNCGLDFSYELKKDKQIVAMEREEHFKLWDCKFEDAILIRYRVPKSVYDEVLRESGY